MYTLCTYTYPCWCVIVLEKTALLTMTVGENILIGGTPGLGTTVA